MITDLLQMAVGFGLGVMTAWGWGWARGYTAGVRRADRLDQEDARDRLTRNLRKDTK